MSLISRLESLVARISTEINGVRSQFTTMLAANAAKSSSRTCSGSPSISNNTWTTINFNVGTLDEILWDNTNNRFTVPTNGYYQISAGVTYTGNATGYRGLRILINGSTTVGQQIEPANTTTASSVNVSVCVKLTAGDTILISTIQTSGGSLTLTPASNQVYVNVARVGLTADTSAIGDLVTNSVTDALETRIVDLENATPPYLGGAWKVNLSANHVVASSSSVDLGNLSLSIPVNFSTDKFVVSFTSDIYATNSGVSMCIAELEVNGVIQPEQHIVSPSSMHTIAGTRYALRQPQTSIWLIDSLPVGTRVFKIKIQGVGTLSQITCSAQHSRLQIWKIL